MSISLNQPLPRPHNNLHPPLRIQWTTDPGAGYIDLTPVSDGVLAVVAGGRALCGLKLSSGDPVFRRDLADSVVDLTATTQGPVTIHQDGVDSILSSFSWNGDLRWQLPSRLQMGLRSLRGAGDRFLALGVPPAATGTVVAIYDAADGRQIAEYPNPGDLPDLTPRGPLSSVRSRDAAIAGLFLFDTAEKRLVRLVPDSHTVRAVSGSIAVIDTYDDGVAQPRAIAVDTSNGAGLWTGDGGPNLVFEADEQHVASVVKRGNGFAATLRDLRTGTVVWESDPIEGGFATVQLAADAVLVFVDSARLLVFERASGKLAQTLDEPSTVVYGGCLTAAGLIDVCSREVRCLLGGVA